MIYIAPELEHFAAVEIDKHAECSQQKEIASLADKYHEPHLKEVARHLAKKTANVSSSGSGFNSGSGSSSSSSTPEPKQPEALLLDA